MPSITPPKSGRVPTQACVRKAVSQAVIARAHADVGGAAGVLARHAKELSLARDPSAGYRPKVKPKQAFEDKRAAEKRAAEEKRWAERADAERRTALEKRASEEKRAERSADLAAEHKRERRGATLVHLREVLDERPVSTLHADLNDLAEQRHWLTGALVVAAPAVGVAVDPRIQGEKVLVALEADARGAFNTAYALQNYSDPRGTVSRLLWIVDAEGACFDVLSCLGQASSLLDLRLDVIPVGGWGPIEAWGDCIDRINPRTADVASPREKKKAAKLEAFERALRAKLRQSIYSDYLVRACLADDAELARKALELGADPGHEAYGVCAEVACGHGAALECEELLEWWKMQHRPHVDFHVAIQEYLHGADLPEDLPEEASVDVVASVLADSRSVAESHTQSRVHVDAIVEEETVELPASRTSLLDRISRKYQ